MESLARLDAMDRQDADLAAVFSRERQRLGAFIRRRVPDPGDAEDILQDVFQSFVAAWRLPEPIEQAGAWLFQAARRRIIDRFRKRREAPVAMAKDGDLGELLPDAAAGPEAAYARSLLLDALQAALAELPSAQREVFIAHELEGRSFKTLAAETGVGVNTLLGRKRTAVLHLRRRLQPLYDEFDF